MMLLQIFVIQAAEKIVYFYENFVTCVELVLFLLLLSQYNKIISK